MTKARTSTLVAAAAALSLVAAGGVYAQARGGGPWGGPGEGEGMGPLRGAARFLELTDDQKTRLQDLMEQGRPERERLRDATREAHERFREAIEVENPDPTTVGQAAIEMHALRAQHEANRKSFEAAFESLLTPDQLRKWEMMQASRAAGGPGPGGPGPGHRGPRGQREWR